MSVKTLTVKELQQWRESGKQHLLIDVREPFEREIAEIGGEHIPLGEFQAKAPEISKELPIVIYCKGGVRSEQACRYLAQAFELDEVFNLVGGITAWSEEVDSSVPSY